VKPRQVSPLVLLIAKKACCTELAALLMLTMPVARKAAERGVRLKA
jgi:hypothetical protein